MSPADKPPFPVRFRRAGVGDAEQIADLHADSWRRHYRGAYADAFLDGDVAADRRVVWSARLRAPAGTDTILAMQGRELVGFIHVVFDDDPTWGSLIDNLHVIHDQRRTGIGAQLLVRTARAVTERAPGTAMYLWVLEQNIAAQQFYRSFGAVGVQTTAVSAPGGDPTRLNGAPRMLRMSWSDPSRLGDALDDS